MPAHHGVVEMDREGFVVKIIKLNPSSSLVSMRLSVVRKLSSRTSERNGNRLLLVHVATRLQQWLPHSFFANSTI